MGLSSPSRMSQKSSLRNQPSPKARGRHFSHPVKSFGLFISTMSYVRFRIVLRFENTGSWHDSRETTAYPASTLVLLSSRTCCISLATIQHILRILPRAVPTRVVYFRTLGASGTVRITLWMLSEAYLTASQSIPSFFSRMVSVSLFKRSCFLSLEHGRIMANGGEFTYCIESLNVWHCPRPDITIIFTIAAVAVSFAWLGVEDPSKWQAGVVLYILGCKYVS